tara:strand:- start:3977 stop:4399 length:423 start_codon:yes stop_codon:yes gene_type:complete
MNKVKLKHRDPNIQMSESVLKTWIHEGIDEGLNGSNIEDVLNELFNTAKMRKVIVNALVPYIINAVTPYYKDEFYSSISHDGETLVISPFWDDYWQEIKIIDMVKESILGFDTKSLTILKKSFEKSIEIINEAIINQKGE